MAPDEAAAGTHPTSSNRPRHKLPEPLVKVKGASTKDELLLDLVIAAVRAERFFRNMNDGKGPAPEDAEARTVHDLLTYALERTYATSRIRTSCTTCGAVVKRPAMIDGRPLRVCAKCARITRAFQRGGLDASRRERATQEAAR